MTDAPPKAKLFFLIRAENEKGIAESRRRITLDFTSIEVESPVMADGEGIAQFVSTTAPIFLSELPDIKRFAMKLESTFWEQGFARVNLDVGYVADKKVVVASRHDNRHKICLARDVYGEVVMTSGGEGGKFAPCSWAAEVYGVPASLAFFRSTSMALCEEPANA